MRTIYAYTFSPSFNQLTLDFTRYVIEPEKSPEMRGRLVLKVERVEDESTWLKVRKNDNPSFFGVYVRHSHSMTHSICSLHDRALKIL